MTGDRKGGMLFSRTYLDFDRKTEDSLIPCASLYL